MFDKTRDSDDQMKEIGCDELSLEVLASKVVWRPKGGDALAIKLLSLSGAKCRESSTRPHVRPMSTPRRELQQYFVTSTRSILIHL